MGKFLVAGIVQKETIVRVNRVLKGELSEEKIVSVPDTIFSSTGGDAYNEALALQWLGNSVDLMSMVGRDDGVELINPSDSENLVTDYVLPCLLHTPAAVVICDEERNQYIFEDRKDLENTGYDPDLFQERAARAEMLVVSNVDFCRPLLRIGSKLRKPVAVNIRGYRENSPEEHVDFLKAADILYLNDDGLSEEPFEFVKSLAVRYRPKIIILGQGSSGLVLYDKEKNIIAHYDSVNTHKTVNTAGAGNALFSCFLHFYNKTHDSVFAVKNALLFASYKVGFVGTSNGFMTEEEIAHWRNLIWRDGR